VPEARSLTLNSRATDPRERRTASTPKPCFVKRFINKNLFILIISPFKILLQDHKPEGPGNLWMASFHEGPRHPQPLKRTGTRSHPGSAHYPWPSPTVATWKLFFPGTSIPMTRTAGNERWPSSPWVEALKYRGLGFSFKFLTKWSTFCSVHFNSRMGQRWTKFSREAVILE
jgi:hypothetical protein